MKIEFPALHSEPLIYFLLHSGVFILAMGLLFFLLGLWFGALVWGRYKRKCQALHTENEAFREEIANLKRKLAEQSMRPTSAAVELPKILTEQLPSVSEIFPERVSQSFPALAALPAPEETPPVESPEVTPTHDHLLIPSLPELDLAESPTATPRVTVRPKLKKTPILSALPEALPETETAVEPFGFLIAEPAELAASAKTLSAIIRGSAAPAEIDPPAPEPAEIKPENDPELGQVFREPPPEPDDLTQIKGISPALQKRLQELGIYTFKQITSWEERHIREISNRLAFKDRIVREKWVEQASALNQVARSV